MRSYNELLQSQASLGREPACTEEEEIQRGRAALHFTLGELTKQVAINECPNCQRTYLTNIGNAFAETDGLDLGAETMDQLVQISIDTLTPIQDAVVAYADHHELY